MSSQQIVEGARNKAGAQNGKFELTMAENDPGLPDDFSMGNSESPGTMLIDTFAYQLEADAEITESNNGTEFSFRFSPN